MRNMTNPCKDCTQRHVACHSDCPKMPGYPEWLEEQRAKKPTENYDARRFLIENAVKTIKRNNRR